MDLGIKNKVALVNGATAGIGKAIAKTFLDEGAKVIVASRSSDNIERTVKEFEVLYSKDKVEGIELDLSKLDSIDRALNVITQKYTIDILVINSGGPPAGKLQDLTLEDWNFGYRILIESAIRLSQHVIAQMKNQNWGRILNVSSTSAKELIPNLPISATFRSGLSAWTKDMAREYGPSGILVNNLLPGLTDTQRLSHLEENNPGVLKRLSADVGLKRLADPMEIARVAVFACSSANTYMTGTDILVDGGFTKAF